MNQLTKTEIEWGYRFWRRHYEHAEIDKWISPFLELEYSYGWLKKIRKARYMSMEQVAARLKIAHSSYSEIEVREFEGTITIQNLRKVAKALDCDLIYGLRPKDRQLYSHEIWKRLVPECQKHPWIKKCSPIRKANALAALARIIMKSPKLKKSSYKSEGAF